MTGNQRFRDGSLRGVAYTLPAAGLWPALEVEGAGVTAPDCAEQEEP